MARDILSDFGPDRSDGGSRASSGGVTRAKDVMNYSPPQGPLGIMHKGVGLGGSNLGMCGTQGRHDVGARSSGSPGLHGNNRGMGTNRKG